jgi:hypothetical protein
MSDKIIDKVLTYVDSPFKLFAVILMALVAFLGYVFWANQRSMIELMM